MRSERLGAALMALLASCASSGPVRSSDPVTGAPERASGAALFRQNDVVAYTISDASGKKLGRVHSTFLKSEHGEPQVVTRIVIDRGDGATQIEHATTFRTDLSPIVYKRLSSESGRYELKFGSEKIDVATDRSIRTVKAGAVRAPIVPEHDLMMLALAIDDHALSAGSSEIIDVWAPEAMDSEPWRVLSYARPAGGLKVDLPGAKAELDQSGRVVRFERAGLVFEPEVPPGKPPQVAYAPPLSYEKPESGRWDDRPLSIPVQGGVLAGVISVPRDRAVWPKRLAPVVVFVSGRGEQDRHGFEGSMDLGTWELLDGLADRGYAVVRLDDRGVGESKSELDPRARGIGSWTGDVLAVLAAIDRQPDVDPERVFLIGHGFGGVVAILAASRAPVAGLILIGAPARPLAGLRSREEAQADREGVGAELRVKRVLAALSGDAAAEQELGVDRLRPYRAERALIEEAAKLDLPAAIAKVKAPAVVVQGLKDFEASWREDAQPLVEALQKSSGKDRVKLLAYDHVDHLLKSEPRRSSLARYADRSRRVEPRVIEDLARWLDGVVKREP